ncbi:PTS system mannose/fructose/N-acetylgalactosamine-transporter subunit IIB [Alicyclobacillus dauci]|uniref:PTS sugar transporter subunit IIB n=1 Tax=Alicyclobacillus dauci TaxID=1475485 RepID=A0ABY6Z120_9BACL|nr:PTS sugar transporter subunit IIB [Alicyclobacillus dauci]WAH36029.1 PTS sugar transporter subunit IIB [Alicyclobacillus dauci]
MTVKHLRIDNRLIHGQVTTNWVNSVGASHILVVNDQVAKDPIQKRLLPAAARGVKTSVLGIAEAIAYVTDAANASEHVLVVAKFPSDALVLLEGGVKPEQVNVGNQAPIPGTNYKMVTKSIAVTAEDAAVYRRIVDLGFHLTSQMLPSDGKADFISLLEKKGL